MWLFVSWWQQPYTRYKYSGSRAGAVVRVLAFHQCGLGSIPGFYAICGLSLLVLYSALRGFSLGTPVFPSPQKPTLAGVTQWASARISEQGVPSLIFSDFNVCFDFPLIHVAIAFNIRQTEHWQRKGGKKRTAGFHWYQFCNWMKLLIIIHNGNLKKLEVKTDECF